MKENILIIGGGIAGLEAAAQLLRLGYNPIIVEKEDRLGGHVARWNRLFPDMSPAEDIVARLTAAAGDANIFLNTRIAFVNKLKDSYNIMLTNGISVITRILLFATGFSLFDASKKEEYGYGVYDKVMTNSDLENWFNTGHDERIPEEGPRAMGFVHCVGSRDEKAKNPQCSKVCCITAVKQAIEMKQKFPDAMVYCFYMDLRMFGKKYEDFYISAERDYGVRFIRGRVAEVSENIEGNLFFKAEKTLSAKPIKVTLDLLVLMSGIVCNQEICKSAAQLSLPMDSDGFHKSRDNIADIIESPKEGIFYAGACTGPKTVPETLAEARAAALEIHNYITSTLK